jgi:hypothetical protein
MFHVSPEALIEAVRQVSVPAQPPRAVRRYRTGRSMQINIKARPEDIQRLQAMADAHRWPLGEVLEYALDALEKKLAR